MKALKLKIKKWIAIKFLNLYRVEWMSSPMFGRLEVRIFFADTSLLLLTGKPSRTEDKWIWEREHET